jgi:hypothetical protein
MGFVSAGAFMSSRPARVPRQPKAIPPRRSAFWETKSIEDLAAEQGVRPINQLEEVLGKGANLWKDDSDLDEFLAGIRERRQKGS